MRKLPVLFIVCLLVAACSSKQHGDDREGDLFGFLTDCIPDTGIRTDRPAPPAPPVMSPEVFKSVPYAEVFNDSNYLQYMSAERLGIDPLNTLREAYHTRRPLVKIESGENYEVASLTHSMPFLVPEAAALLDEIGSDFRKLVVKNGGKDVNRIVVTSLLRSPYSVRLLKRVNRNAVDSSTHKFATTFDIGYNAFACSDTVATMGSVKLKQLLAEVLLAKRNEGKCFVKYETKSPCFHITVHK